MREKERERKREGKRGGNRKTKSDGFREKKNKVQLFSSRPSAHNMSHNPSHPHAPLAPAGPRRTELHCGPHVQWGPQANRPADDTIPLAPAPRAHIVLSVSPFYYPRLCKRDPRGRPPPHSKSGAQCPFSHVRVPNETAGEAQGVGRAAELFSSGLAVQCRPSSPQQLPLPLSSPPTSIHGRDQTPQDPKHYPQGTTGPRTVFLV